MHIKIPENLKLPADAETRPFRLEGMFLAMGDHLMPLEIGGQPVPSNSEGYEGEEAEEYEEEGCCDKCGGKGKMHNQAPKGNSFVVAIERSMKR